MPGLQQIDMSEYQLLPQLSCGFLQIESADKLPLCEVVYSRNSDAHISLTFWGKTSGQEGDVSLLSIQMCCLPEERAEFDRVIEFFSDGKTTRARLPEGVKFELTTLAPKGVPSSWTHDAFPRGGHDIIHTYASDQYAMLIRYRGKAMTENALFRRVNRNLRVVEGQWDLMPPPCQLRKGLKPGATERPLKAGVVKEISEAVQRAYAYLNLNPAEVSAELETVQRSICEAVDKLIAARKRPSGKAAEDLAIDLGCLWGQMLCDALGWQWCSLKYGRSPAVYAVVSPDRSSAVAPMHYMSRQIGQRGAHADNTTLLLFNMMKEKATGQARPKAYKMFE